MTMHFRRRPSKKTLDKAADKRAKQWHKAVYKTLQSFDAHMSLESSELAEYRLSRALNHYKDNAVQLRQRAAKNTAAPTEAEIDKAFRDFFYTSNIFDWGLNSRKRQSALTKTLKKADVASVKAYLQNNKSDLILRLRHEITTVYWSVIPALASLSPDIAPMIFDIAKEAGEQELKGRQGTYGAIFMFIDGVKVKQHLRLVDALEAAHNKLFPTPKQKPEAIKP